MYTFTTTTTTTNSCEGAIGDPCQEHEDCRANEHLFCNPSLLKCDCADGYIFDTDILMCAPHGLEEKMPGGMGIDCKKDEECNVDENLKCDDKIQKCNCMDEFFLHPEMLVCVR
ncbi:unnamed protein product [Darwinula stevensoni]|uniref:Uncharacterized protein n=1 Tax=Darwinula stevensoni TaxID=69355 RepID=A0A7R9FT62_9CRUS|nr:unnamed protein product [Darwinula stevensoni]CAG0904777.1 unnamed protein product [Darwinula stevensoni]